MKPTQAKQLKQLITPWRAELYDFSPDRARAVLNAITGDALFRVCYPFGDFTNADAFFDAVFVPLAKAIPDLERRDTIVMAGVDEHGADWVGCCGYYTGLFLAPWLDIPPTGHQAHMRFHEFYRIENNKVVEAQLLWDIPELIMQANAWPLAPSLGRIMHVPGPASQDGLTISGSEKEALATRTHIIEMLKQMQKHPRQGPEAMRMEHFWHEKMNWYGPAGIGSVRTIAGFRHWHQIPFLTAMPDREISFDQPIDNQTQQADQIKHNFFAEGQYAAVAGWPNMRQTLSKGGWLGIAPAGKCITLRSLDFWRVENGKIRENWVLIDLLDVYAQLGVDVFARLREFNKARNLAPITFTRDY